MKRKLIFPEVVAAVLLAVIASTAAPAAATEAGTGTILTGKSYADIDFPAGNGFPICGYVTDSGMSLNATGTWTAGQFVQNTQSSAVYAGGATITVEADGYYANPAGTYKLSSGGCGTVPEAVAATATVYGASGGGDVKCPPTQPTSGSLSATMIRVNTTVTVTITGNCHVDGNVLGFSPPLGKTSNVSIVVQGEQQPCGLVPVGPVQDCLVTDWTGGTYTET